MKRELPERHPEWLTDNDWSAESRLKWIKTLSDIDGESWLHGLSKKSAKYPNRYAIYCLFTFDDKKQCEIHWESYIDYYEFEYCQSRTIESVKLVRSKNKNGISQTKETYIT